MMLSKAFGFGVLLCLSISSSGESQDTDIFVTKAVRSVISKMFLQSFMRHTFPVRRDVDDGSKLYGKMKENGFQEIGKAGSISQLSPEKMKDVVNLWKTVNLISSEEVVNINRMLSEKPIKTILEHASARSNGEIVYGITGFVELSGRADKERIVTSFYSFKNFKISKPVAVTYKRESVSGGTCKLWGQFCPTIFKVAGLSDSESKSLFSYFRSATLNAFVAEIGQYQSQIENELLRYKQFIPETFKAILEKMDNNRDKLPNEIFAKDPFTIYY